MTYKKIQMTDLFIYFSEPTSTVDPDSFSMMDQSLKTEADGGCVIFFKMAYLKTIEGDKPYQMKQNLEIRVSVEPKYNLEEEEDREEADQELKQLTMSLQKEVVALVNSYLEADIFPRALQMKRAIEARFAEAGFVQKIPLPCSVSMRM